PAGRARGRAGREMTAPLPPPSAQAPHPRGAPPPSPPPPPPPLVQVRRGVGFIGAFMTGIVAAAIVLVAAVGSLPYWPKELRLLWHRSVVAEPVLPPPPAPTIDTAALDAAKRQINQ